MGIHDFICFIQNNGQNLVKYEIPDEDFLKNFEFNFETVGGRILYLVDVSRFSDEEIYSSSLKIFEPFSEENYSWDSWEIQNKNGYRDFICDDQLIFRYDDSKYLTFSPHLYNLFIKNNDPENVLYCVYCNIFINLHYLEGERAKLYKKYNKKIIEKIYADFESGVNRSKKMFFNVIVYGTKILNEIWCADHQHMIDPNFKIFLLTLRRKKITVPKPLKQKIAILSAF